MVCRGGGRDGFAAAWLSSHRSGAACACYKAFAMVWVAIRCSVISPLRRMPGQCRWPLYSLTLSALLTNADWASPLPPQRRALQSSPPSFAVDRCGRVGRSRWRSRRSVDRGGSRCLLSPNVEQMQRARLSTAHRRHRVGDISGQPGHDRCCTLVAAVEVAGGVGYAVRS